MVGEAFCLGSGVFPIRDRLSDLRWTCFVIGDTSSVSSYAGFSLQSGEEDEAMEWNGIVGECCFGSPLLLVLWLKLASAIHLIFRFYFRGDVFFQEAR